MLNNDTVFALSTPVGGAITVMRISGANARAVLAAVFTGRIEHRRASFGKIVDPDGSLVDTATAVFYAAPHSYTGEDMAEISCHGSYAVAVKLMELIADTGLARQAEAGEFTKRAYLNGKLDLAQAEAVMDLIGSSAERSRRAAAIQLEGRLSAVISEIYEDIKLVCAFLANVMDDDTGEAALDEADFYRKIKEISSRIDELVRSGMRASVLREGARAALIGSPNVGKSSLLNALIMRERAIVTAIPGTTRDTVEESVSIDGVPVTLIDTAGIRESRDEVERIGIDRSIREAETADLVLWLVDGTRPLNDEDATIFDGVSTKNTLAVITKADLDACVFPDDSGLFRGLPAVKVSSLTGEGLGALRKRVASMLLREDSGESFDPIITNSRHIALLKAASENLTAASELILTGDTDAPYYELREAMERLAELLGRADPSEELVDSIFANFCLGK